jgi:tRNA pseudouridine55 synthase
VRSLLRDVGDALGCGAHLTRLVRTAAGPLALADAVLLERLTPAAVRGPEVLVAHLPRRDLTEDERAAVVHGRPISAGGTGDGDAAERVALFAHGELVGVAERAAADGMPVLKPRVVLVDG